MLLIASWIVTVLPFKLSESFLFDANSSPVVNTTCGPIEGVTQHGGHGFRGIPYALPPVGNLRWQPPEKLSRADGTCWNGTFSAKKYGNICFQYKTRTTFHGSEDCLYMNVFTPTLDKNAKLPVMVWVHGGSYFFGSGNDDTYFADEKMSGETNVVYVNHNYRLHTFGFMALQMLAAVSPTNTSGNYAFLDTLVVLEWVQTNIQNFGGDPSQVTLYGQSAGSTHVLGLLASPLSKGLFHKAWMSSGCSRYDKLAKDAYQDNMIYLERTNCSTVSCLLALTSQQATEAVPWGRGNGSDLVITRNLTRFDGSMAIVDGYVVPMPPFQAFASGFKMDVPVLVDVLEDVIMSCNYRRAFRDDVIVVQGDRGDCFYVMLSGRTSVYIDTTKTDDDLDMTNSADDNASQTTPDTDDAASDKTDSPREMKKKKPTDRSKYGKFIIHFDAGKSFGEIALISEDSVRNATVIADEETDMLLIHRDLFNRSMKAQQEKEYEEKKAFIDNCRLFRDWSQKFKHLLEMSIRKEVYPYGTQIMRQGDPAEGLYFIVSGQAKVTTEPSRHKLQYPQLMTQVSIMEKEFGRQNKENQLKKSQNGLTQHQIRVRRKEGYAAAEKRFMSKSLELCCVEGNEIQGDLEMAMEMTTSACTVTCTAMNTAVFILDAKTYERLILKKNLHTITKLKEGVLRKLRSRIATSNGGNVHLLRIIHDRLQEELKPKVREQTQKMKTENDKSAILTQMIKLYLKDKVPLIDPILPDSFHNRLMSEKRNKQIEKFEKKKEEQGTAMRRRKNRMPRSMKQLQNSAAETELMNPDRSWLGSVKPSKDRHIRPKTALGIESRSYFEEESERPETSPAHQSSVFHLTECETSEEMGQTVVQEKAVLVTEEYDHVFKQMDTIQRGKSAARSRVICSVAAKHELREETQRAQLGFGTDDMYDFHDDDYFDYETSTSNLKNLEDRIKIFCDEVRHRRINDPVRIDEMRSFHVKDSDNVPMSGGTVYVNRKPCGYPKSVRLSKDVHQHVRRFIITRNNDRYASSSSALVRSKSSLGFTAGRPKSAW